MMRPTFDKALFLAAAAFNLSTAAMLFLRPEIALARLGITDMSARLLAQSLASSAATWGVGYALVAVNVKRFRDFAWLGAISKMLFALIYAAAFFNGRVTATACVPALVDFIFAVLFANFLRRTKTQKGR